MYGCIILLYEDLKNEIDPEKIEKIIFNSKLDSTVEKTDILFQKSYSIKLGKCDTNLSKI